MAQVHIDASRSKQSRFGFENLQFKGDEVRVHGATHRAVAEAAKYWARTRGVKLRTANVNGSTIVWRVE